MTCKCAKGRKCAKCLGLLTPEPVYVCVVDESAGLRDKP